jgi:hypothetical protein
VHASAAQFNHPRAQRSKPRHIKLGFGVKAPDPLRCRWGQNPIGAHNRARFTIVAAAATHQKVFAVSVEYVYVMFFRRAQGGTQASPELLNEHLVPEALRLAHFALVASPKNLEARGLTRSGQAANIATTGGQQNRPAHIRGGASLGRIYASFINHVHTLTAVDDCKVKRWLLADDAHPSGVNPMTGHQGALIA